MWLNASQRSRVGVGVPGDDIRIHLFTSSVHFSVDSADTFPGAANSQLELGGQINLVVADSPQGLTSILGTGIHAQAMTNSLGSGQLMDTSPTSGQPVATSDQSSESSFCFVDLHCHMAHFRCSS